MNHGVEHLGCGDALLAHALCHADHLLLQHRDVLEGHLDSEVAARDHDAVRDLEDLLEVLDALHGLDLCDDLDVLSAVLAQDVAHLADIGGGSREACRNVVKAGFAPEDQIVPVLRADERHRQVCPGDVDALVVRDLAAVAHGADDVRIRDLIDAHADETVIDEDGAADRHILRKALVGDGAAGLIAQDLLGGQGELLTGLEFHGAVLEIAQADLRSLGVQEGGDRKIQLLAHLQHLVKALLVLLVGAMGKIEAGDIHAGLHQFADGLLVIARRSECADDLGLSHSVLQFSSDLISVLLLKNGYAEH